MACRVKDRVLFFVFKYGMGINPIERECLTMQKREEIISGAISLNRYKE